MGELATMADAWLMPRLPAAMEALGIRATGMVSHELDTPYPPASKPGESPHKRTGNLQAGVSHAEIVNTEFAQTTITSQRAEDDPRIPQWLEFGNFKMEARPYMRPVLNQGERIVPESLKKSLSSEVAYAAAG